MANNFNVHEVQRLGRHVGAVHRPRTIDGALQALHHDQTARPLAGGTDLLLDLERGGPGTAVNVVDLSAIEAFTAITDDGDHFRLAGGVRHNQIVQHDELRRSALPLAQACLEVGSPQLRNRATIAGNLVTASPANDTISALMALRASIEISCWGETGAETRTVAVDAFFTGLRQTILQPAELITAIVVPKLASNERAIWVKLGLRRAQAISVVHAGIVVSFADDPEVGSPTEFTVTDARLAMGSVAPTVVLVGAFRDALVGVELNADTIAAAARAVSSSVTPITDGRATADYRHSGIEVLINRSLLAIAEGAEAAMWPDDPPTLSSKAGLEKAANAPQDVLDGDSLITIELNGQTSTARNTGATLLDHVRETAGATGMKEGCGEGECGACTMLVDGSAVMSCLVSAAQADGATVVTVEGLDHPIQRAFVDEFAVQCGFCIPGFLVSGARLLDEVDDPTNEQINHAFSGNLCRCTGYYPIIEAVHSAAVEIRGTHG